MEKGESHPTAQMLSDQTGVSTSTIFRLYKDLEVLFDTAMRIQYERVGSMLAEIPVDQAQAVRIRELVDMRTAFHEKITTVRRFAFVRRSCSKRINKGLGLTEQYFHSQNQQLFDAELTAFNCSKEILDVIDTLTSWRDNRDRPRFCMG